ncbi:hypothetical protein MTR67_027158, partial [Solanum verrucosum]
ATMARISLTRLCLQEEDHELEEVRCKHRFVLPLLTSWTPRNPSRRYWGCPYYGNARSCDFWLWKDDYIDPRSKHRFVLPLLTSWTPRNPSRRYWGCPYYGVS